MKTGDLVCWKASKDLHTEIGLVLEVIGDINKRGGDPFPHHRVLFPRGVLQCRESDLEVVE